VSILKRSLGSLLEVSPEEVSVIRRGFRVSAPSTTEALERIGGEFLGGYHAALEEDSASSLASRLSASVAPAFLGFAFEGAAMALTLLDHIAPPGRRFETFVSGSGQDHAYMCHVGAGWAVARLPWLRLRLAATLREFEPLGRWLVMDGYGFHEGFFHLQKRVLRAEVPWGVRGYGARAFDQGLGRSLWFVDGMDPVRIPQTIASFPASRHADLWSGVGLACGYAGGASEAGVALLLESAGPHVAAFRQGVAFAAKARIRANTPADHLEMVCRTACDSSPDALADLCGETMKNLPPDGAEPAYEIWRRRIQSEVAA
jgi:hypothetical protein